MNTYFQMIDDLITFNLEHRKKFLEHKEHVSPIIWAYEFCTVHCDLGRAVGKTSYIAKNVTNKDVVIVSNNHTRQNLYRVLLNMNKSLEIRDRIFTSEQIKEGNKPLLILPTTKNIERVYIDEPSFIFRWIDPFLIYETFRNSEPTYILLGK